MAEPGDDSSVRRKPVDPDDLRIRYRRELVNLGERVRAWREARDLSQEAAAKALGTSQSTISTIESGERDPGICTVLLLADALDIPIGDIVGRSQQDLVRRLTQEGVTVLVQGTEPDAPAARTRSTVRPREHAKR